MAGGPVISRKETHASKSFEDLPPLSSPVMTQKVRKLNIADGRSGSGAAVAEWRVTSPWIIPSSF